GDPTEAALIVAASKAGIEKQALEKRYPRIKEIPFTSERKLMTTVNKINGKYMVCVKGAPERVLSLCKKTLTNKGTQNLTSFQRKNILKKTHEMTGKALRVLAIAYKEDRQPPKNIESNLIFLGLVGMIDPPREGVKESIALCKQAGIRVVMITGDHVNTAIAIAKDLGIFSPGDKAITGEELNRLSDKQLENTVEKISVYARVNPEHKVKIVDALKKKGHIIAMTGDGVNDAPALKAADIGIAMGIKGTDVAKEASDMILRDDNFTTIVKAVKEGRGIYENIKKFVQYLLSSNIGEILIVFIAMLISLVDPETGLILLPIQLLWINVLTDALPALALGVDPPSPDIMKKKPRDPKEAILSHGMMTDIIFVGALICLGTLFLFWLNLPEGGKKAMTVAFTSIVIFELVRVQAVRMKFRIGMFSNTKLLMAIGISIIMQLAVIYTPALQEVFRTVFLNILDWGEIILVASLLMITMWLKEKLAPGEW
ncbi:hypothetical protein DRJ04_08365, partial [Candidatus Aerophobetes bacterium]